MNAVLNAEKLLEIRRRLEKIELSGNPLLTSKGFPRTDASGICLACEAWTPNGHPEAHDHREDCPSWLAHNEYLVKKRIFLSYAQEDIRLLLDEVDSLTLKLNSIKLLLD